jgi:manganese efflux pump family protein
LLLRLLILGVVIGSNNLATALALGSLGRAVRTWRILIVFCCVEFTVPFAGVWLGRQFSSFLAVQAGWLGPLLLIGLGMVTVRSAARESFSPERLLDAVTSWPGLVLLALSLSADNLLIGFSLGLADARPLLVASTIALFSTSFAWFGLRLGGRLNRRWGRLAGQGAGLLLILLGSATFAGLL